jgi:hypothetical protein
MAKTTRGKIVKMVNCYECKKELKFTDAKPLWNRLDKDPDFLCEECTKNVPRLDDEFQIAALIARTFIKHNQPERSKREDSQKEMRCSEHGGNIVRDK